MADPLAVELVAADRTVWTGEAAMVVTRTADGDVGILPHHAPLLGTLADGAVQIRQESGEEVVAVVHGGFLSVADNRVGILAEEAALAQDIELRWQDWWSEHHTFNTPNPKSSRTCTRSLVTRLMKR